MSKQLPWPWWRLDGKVVLVTGASSVLGRDFCLDLAKAGCKIFAAARRTDRLNSLCEQIHNLVSTSNSSTITTTTGASFPSYSSRVSAMSLVQCVAVELDVTSEGSAIEACVQRAWDAFGRIDVHINNAGVGASLIYCFFHTVHVTTYIKKKF